MKKFLIAGLLLLLMSTAAFAADKPRVMVMDVEIANVLDEQTNTLVDFGDRAILNDLLENFIFDSQEFDVFANPNEHDYLELGIKGFASNYDVQYLFRPEVVSLNTRETVLDNGLVIYKTRVVLKIDMVDAKTNEVLYSAQAVGKSTSETDTALRIANAMKKAVDKTGTTLLKKYEADIR
ncbi:MAG: hypothetical protein IJ668_06750 [Selenomonadaceae bacterium]|nr:hypothetical protein [Selenomonadaceae bacterium]MBR1580180.1 hypothetical protein [Selenomonadaceae bacterium]